MRQNSMDLKKVIAKLEQKGTEIFLNIPTRDLSVNSFIQLIEESLKEIKEDIQENKITKIKQIGFKKNNEGDIMYIEYVSTK